jgi:hypothetical protein
VRRRRKSCCARVALARSFLKETVDFLSHFFLGVLAFGSESHVSPNMFRLCPVTSVEMTGFLKCYIF